MSLNDVYHVHNSFLFRKYIQVNILACEFESIMFSHVPREENNYIDTIASKIIDWNLSHTYTRSHP